VAFLDRPEGRLAIALGIGLVIGAERERRKGEGPRRSPAGVRTFAIVGLLGGVAALLGSAALLVALAVVVGALAVAGYYLGERTDPGFTTEVALVLTYCLGALAGHDPKAALAAGLSAATILAFRTHLHSAVRSVLSEDELRDALLFAVAAVVVLPLLPNRAVDPFGVLNLFTLWRLVVLLMGMSGAGYVAQRVIGPRYGLALAGFASGFVSSSATIAAMGGRARADAMLLRPAVAGAAASTVATFVQLALLVGAADPRLLATLAWPLAGGGATAFVYALFQSWRTPRVEAGEVRGRAFKLTMAISFALLVTAITFVSTLARKWLGPAGAVAAAALAGLADAHSPAAALASLSGSEQLARHTAELGVLLALTTNTITKGVLALTSGPRGFALRIIAGLVLVLLTTWAVALVGWLR
jgi:uncharacterized membrane protein (DUF4010 family)